LAGSAAGDVGEPVQVRAGRAQGGSQAKERACVIVVGVRRDLAERREPVFGSARIAALAASRPRVASAALGMAGEIEVPFRAGATMR